MIDIFLIICACRLLRLESFATELSGYGVYKNRRYTDHTGSAPNFRFDNPIRRAEVAKFRLEDLICRS